MIGTGILILQQRVGFKNNVLDQSYPHPVEALSKAVKTGLAKTQRRTQDRCKPVALSPHYRHSTEIPALTSHTYKWKDKSLCESQGQRYCIVVSMGQIT